MAGRARPTTRRIVVWTIAIAVHVALIAAVVAGLRHEPPPAEITIDLTAPLPPPPPPPSEKVRPTGPEKIPVPQSIRVPRVRLFQLKPVPESATSMPAIPIPASPPQPPSPAPDVVAPPPTYIAELFAHLSRYKRYPRSAQAAREQGTAYLRFTMDRQGRVLNHHIDRSTGYADLDREVDSMIERAQPLPRLPAEMPDRLEIVIPIQFLVR